MAQASKTRSYGSTSDATALVDQLASFLKAAFIYPKEHRRVWLGADAFLKQVSKWIDPLTWVAVRVRGEDDIVVAEHAAESLGPLAGWMQDCLRDAALAGLEFGPAIDEETLFEFADCLRQSVGKAAPEFSKLWPEDHQKLRPLDLVFKGGHSKEGSGRGVVASGVEGDTGTAGTSQADVWKLDIVRQLLDDSWISAKLSSVERCLEQEVLQTDALGGVDLLTEIVKLLPADVQREPTRVAGVVEQVLDSIQGALLTMVRDRPDEVDADLIRTAIAVAKKYFENRAESKKAIEPGLPTGRPGDEKIDDDVARLLEEYEKLPVARSLCLPMTREQLVGTDLLGAELLGIYVYLLTTIDRRNTTRKLETCLAKCLEKPSEEQLLVLDSYFQDIRGVDAETDVASNHPGWRIIGALHNIGLARLVQSRDYLTPERIAASFPLHFVTYVESLTDRATDLDKLRRAVKAIRPERLQVGVEILKGEGTLENSEVIDKILAIGGEAVLPLIAGIAHIDEEWARTRVGLYLRRLSLPSPEASALRCVEPPSRLPVKYLEDLARVALTRDGDAKVRSLSGALLRKFIDETANQPGQVERRLNAIRVLRFLPSPETEKFLRDLSRAGRFYRFGSAARAARRAATESLKALTT